MSKQTNKNTTTPAAAVTAAVANEDENIMRFARMHWEWLKVNDLGAVVSGIKNKRMAILLRRIGIQCATEMHRRVTAGEKSAGVEQDLIDQFLYPINRDGQPIYHDPAGAMELAAEFEASEEGMAFAPEEKA